MTVCVKMHSDQKLVNVCAQWMSLFEATMNKGDVGSHWEHISQRHLQSRLHTAQTETIATMEKTLQNVLVPDSRATASPKVSKTQDL